MRILIAPEAAVGKQVEKIVRGSCASEEPIAVVHFMDGTCCLFEAVSGEHDDPGPSLVILHETEYIRPSTIHEWLLNHTHDALLTGLISQTEHGVLEAEKTAEFENRERAQLQRLQQKYGG